MQEERLIERETPFNSPELNRALSTIPLEMLPIPHKVSENMALVLKNTDELVTEIQKTDLISPEDAKNIEKAQTFLLTSYKDVPIYNTRAAKVCSILTDAKFPTSDAKFWQCKMQAEVHFNEFIRSMFKLDRVNVDIEELEYQIKVLDTMVNQDSVSQFDKIKLTFDKRRLENKLSQYKFEIKLLEKDMKQRLREINDWVEIGKTYEESCQYDKNSYDEHTYRTQLHVILNQYNTEKDPKVKEGIKKQLQTLCSLLGIKSI